MWLYRDDATTFFLHHTSMGEWYIYKISPKVWWLTFLSKLWGCTDGVIGVLLIG